MSLSSPAGNLTWQGWASPAICDVLADHVPSAGPRASIDCTRVDGLCGVFDDWQDWREHVSELIAARIVCVPQRAAAALASSMSSDPLQESPTTPPVHRRLDTAD